MDFPFAAVEILFSNKSPDQFDTETGRENQFSARFPGFRQPPNSKRNPI
jgi:hypothetical protein